MATYIGIKGGEIQTFAGDPANPIEGQVWYNTTSNTVKCQTYVIGVGVWSSGGDFVNARLDVGGCGTQTAALIMGAQTAPNDNYTEKYDGTSWTETGDLNTGRGYCAGFGSQTAAVLGGGSPTGPVGDLTETFNGTSWTVANTQPFGTYAQMRAGTSTAGLQGAGGFASGTFRGTESIEWDGTDWTETGDINTGRIYVAGGGTQTSGIFMGGSTPPYSAAVETYNGSTWSTSPASLNSARTALSGSASSATNAICYGADSAPLSQLTESFDGTTWTEVADLAIGASESAFGSTGSNTSCICAGGAVNIGPGVRSGKTEEWNVAVGPATKTFSSS